MTVNLQHIKKLSQLSVEHLEGRIRLLETLYMQAPPDSQPDLLDEVGDYLKALDVRMQIERSGVDPTTALRDLARRMRQFGRSPEMPYSEWLSKPSVSDREARSDADSA